MRRIERILREYPSISLTVVVGDVGVLNRENFLTPSEQVKIVEAVFANRHWERTEVVVVRGGPPSVWVERLRRAVPAFDVVFSDNPFVTDPLKDHGYKVVIHRREGVSSDTVRALPLSDWQSHVPAVVYEYIREHGLHKRLAQLPESGRYPFL